MKNINDVHNFGLDRHFVDGLVDAVIKADHGDKVQRICVFGSYARGEQNQNSDIDLYIILEDGEYTRFNKATIAAKIPRYLAKYITPEYMLSSDVLVHTAQEYKTGLTRKWSLEQNIEREGIVIYDKEHGHRSAA